MLIDCPSCARAYQISRAALSDAGRTVICPACMTRWFVGAAAAIPPPRDCPVSVDPGVGSASADGSNPADAGRDGGTTRAPVPNPAHRVKPARIARQIGVGCACLIAAMVAIGKRTAVVRAAPPMAALYDAVGLPVNVRGLIFGAVSTTRLGLSGDSVSIAGTIRNIASTRNVLPRITFEMRDAQGATLATWSEPAPKHALAVNESVAFLSQAPSLPAGCKDVLVRFTTRADPPSEPSAPLLHQDRPS